ncbi:type II secretion system protein [Rheinheimera mesophila]|uniref:Type II secretion system protein n=1 Tax=Rheinheimera mesophila TaxID=1547515 RepID=A0A3P3QJM9_9GAMM|nr:type II secretion system protein [Rheinheimera mesophila]RRJ21372.1 type II secretion system protein [Rheinheimera mesophila]
MPTIRARVSGFTLIELIIVVLLIGILTVTLLPRFVGKDGVSEFVARDQIVSLLQTVQIRAMQQTSGGCHNLELSSSVIALQAINGCVASPDSAFYFQSSSDSNVTLSLVSYDGNSVLPSSILSFDANGRPVLPTSSGYRVRISADSILDICVESQGYIHAIVQGGVCN